MDSYDLIVIGGGISGLSLAHGAARGGWRTLLLEREGRLGGCIHTVVPADGFWMELGSHTIYNSYGHLIGLLEQAGLAGRVLPRRRLPFRLWSEGRVVSIAAALSFPELLAHIWRLPFTRRAGKSVAEAYAPLFGRRNFERVFGPALDAVICQPAGPFDAESLFRRKPRRKDYPRSLTLDGGIGTLVGALAAAPGLETLTGTEVAAITAADPWRVRTADGREVASARLALAVPPDVAARLLGPVRPALAGLLRGIDTVAVHSVAVVAAADAVALPPVAGIIGRDQPFFSLVSRDVVPDPRYRGFACHLRPGNGKAEALAAAEGVLGVAADRLAGLEEAWAVLPALRPGHAGRAAAIEEALAGDTLAVTGNFFAGMSLEECAARSAAELRRLKAGGQ